MGVKGESERPVLILLSMEINKYMDYLIYIQESIGTPFSLLLFTLARATSVVSEFKPGVCGLPSLSAWRYAPPQAEADRQLDSGWGKGGG